MPMISIDKSAIKADSRAGLPESLNVVLYAKPSISTKASIEGRRPSLTELETDGPAKNITGSAVDPEAVMRPDPRNSNAIAVGRATGIIVRHIIEVFHVNIRV